MDAEDEWTFSNKFDYIHGRALAACFKDPASVLRQAFDSLAPGGYLELQDGVFPFQFIGEPPTESYLQKWGEMMMAGGEKAGRPWNNVQYYNSWLEEIGFEDVVQKTFYWPVGPWAEGEYFKQVGKLFQADLLHSLEGISLKMMGLTGWSGDEIKDFIEGLRKALLDTSIHGYLPM